MEIDPRGPRFGAVITVVVLAAVLVTGSAWLLAAQVDRVRGGRAGRAAVRALRRPLPAPAPAAARAARTYRGRGTAAVRAGGRHGHRGRGRYLLAAGVPVAGLAFTALALIAAFLNAAFDLCLGCQVYLFIQRNQRVRPSA